MRNLLYTLLVGLVIVSCQKDDYGVDSSSIVPLSDVKVTVDLTERFDNFNSFLRGASFGKKDTSTSKGGDNGTDWIELIWFNYAGASNSDNYVYTRPEQLGNACYNNIESGITNIVHETYSYRAASQMVHIEVEGTTGEEFAIPADLQPLYASAFADENSALYFADFATSYSFREGPLPTVPYND